MCTGHPPGLHKDNVRQCRFRHETLGLRLCGFHKFREREPRAGFLTWAPWRKRALKDVEREERKREGGP